MNAVEGGAIELYWLPLGAGGWFVRFNGRVYEALQALRDRRPTLDLFHTALVVTVPEGRFVVENTWPIPDSDGSARGSVVEGPVFDVRLGRLRSFRYEVRCWRDGTIADIAYAVDSPQRVCDDESQARAVLELVESVPPLIWGRPVSGSSEMWNSNSVIAWLLTRAGVDMDTISAPPHGRAPGWLTGITLARVALTPENRLT